MNHKEESEQEAFFTWAAYQSLGDKRLSDVCFAIPNGGRRNMLEAKRMKAQGVKAGVFDVFLAVSCGGYHGLFLEMKVDPNILSDKQLEFKKHASSEGFLCVVCYSAEDMIDEVTMYLKGCKEKPEACILEVNGDYKYKAVCRRMSAKFKTRRGAIGWLGKRGFDEFGQRT